MTAWGAQIIVRTIADQFSYFMPQDYTTQATAMTACTAQAAVLKTQFQNAISNLLPINLFLSMDLNDGQPAVWIRVNQIVSIRSSVYQM